MTAPSINRTLANGLHLSFSFLTWVACCVTFGSALFSSARTYIIFQGEIKLITQFYYNKFYNPRIGGTAKLEYSDYPPAVYRNQLDPERVCESCDAVSVGVALCFSFSFLVLFAQMLMELARWAHYHTRLPCIKSYDTQMLWEMGLSVASYVLYLGGTVLFTVGCFVPAAGSRDFAGIYPTGLVFVWLMLVLQPVAIRYLWILRVDTMNNPPKKSEPTAKYSSEMKTQPSTAATFSPAVSPVSSPTRAARSEEPVSHAIPMPAGQSKIIAPASPPVPAGRPGASPPPPRAGAAKWKVGDKCQAVWATDGAWYPAVVTGVRGNRYNVDFPEYNESGDVDDTQIRPRA